MSVRKSLLVAAALFVSTTAWADEIEDIVKAPTPTATKKPVVKPAEDDDFQMDPDASQPDVANVEERTITPVKPKSAMPGAIQLDVLGKTPLKDNYAISVVAVDRDAVVVELPVLVASSRGTTTFQVIGEVWVGGAKVNEVRSIVTPASQAQYGPSFVFLKVLAPVSTPTGDVKIVVKQAKADGTGAVELFSRATAYSLAQ